MASVRNEAEPRPAVASATDLLGYNLETMIALEAASARRANRAYLKLRRCGREMDALSALRMRTLSMRDARALASRRGARA